MLANARRLALSTGVLRYHFAREVQDISSHWSRYQDDLAAAKVQNVTRCVMTAIAHWPQDGKPALSKKALLRLLMQKPVQPKNALCAEIERVFSLLGLVGS